MGAIGRIAQYHAKSRLMSTTAAETAQILQDMGVMYVLNSPGSEQVLVTNFDLESQHMRKFEDPIRE
jgi:hypothetical protein